MHSDFVKDVDALSTWKKTFVLNVDAWSRIRPPVPLNWQHVKFDSANLKTIPQDSGVYAFVVKSSHNDLPNLSYLMYIGIAGYKKTSPRSLRDRYKNYLKEEVDVIRPKVHHMLNKYQGHVYFCYVSVDKNKCELQELEKMLNDALIPPCNENDFSAEMRPKVKALGL